MSVMREYKPGMITSLSSYERSSLNNGVDALLKSGYLGSDITNYPSKAEASLEKITYLLNDFYKNPGKFDTLKSYLGSKGMPLREPSFVGVFDNSPSAVARTDSENMLEVNLYFDDLVGKMMSDYSLSKDAAEELVLSHELVHMAQPSEVLSARPSPYIAELHAELVLRDYFLNKSDNSSSKADSLKYESIVRAVESRANEYISLLEKNDCCERITNNYLLN